MVDWYASCTDQLITVIAAAVRHPGAIIDTVMVAVPIILQTVVDFQAR